MIRVRQVLIDIDNDTKEELITKVAHKLRVSKKDIKKILINKKSLDARKKPILYFVYEVDVEVSKEDKILKTVKKDVIKTPNTNYIFPTGGSINQQKHIVIVGSGPAGLFAGYMLVSDGYDVTIIERGEKIEDRIKTVDKFWKTNKLNLESNIQFGEGGAGTFSDGKLNTLVKDKEGRMRKVFETFVSFGASDDILYMNKPHIGTDILRTVIINMRNKMIDMGVNFRYSTKLTDLVVKDNCITGIEVNNNEIIETNDVVLALGHSARDTFQMLLNNKVDITAKPFAVGIRIMHPQEMINKSQYGISNHKNLESASYKLTYKAPSGRGVYSFCMCPGGYVVNASSEKNRLVVNGMSYHKRDSGVANSAIVVTVNSNDFGNTPMDAINYQRKLESIAYDKGKALIPIQLYKDFKDNKVSTNFGKFNPMIKGKYSFANINEILPKYICESIVQGIEYFGTKIEGFNREDAIIAGIETRTSSPIRINRNEKFNSNIKGLYPCGEGAGYSGGITTSAMDGIKVAEAIAFKYKNKDIT